MSYIGKRLCHVWFDVGVKLAETVIVGVRGPVANIDCPRVKTRNIFFVFESVAGPTDFRFLNYWKLGRHWSFYTRKERIVRIWRFELNTRILRVSPGTSNLCVWVKNTGRFLGSAL